jgi:hypothetical protein
VITPAVDYALTRPDVDGDNLALVGMSLAGSLNRVRASISRGCFFRRRV